MIFQEVSGKKKKSLNVYTHNLNVMFKIESYTTALAKSQADSCSQQPMTGGSLNSLSGVNIVSRKSEFPDSGPNSLARMNKIC